jgi:hypothetical protein
MKKLILLFVMGLSFVITNAQPQAAAKTKASNSPVKVTDLPKAILDNVAKDYAGFTIKDANLIENEGTSNYHVNIVNGTTSEMLVYDKDGKFIHKSQANSAMPDKKPTANTAKKPVAKSTPKPAPKPAPKK